jgi:hypothetical protein
MAARGKVGWGIGLAMLAATVSCDAVLGIVQYGADAGLASTPDAAASSGSSSGTGSGSGSESRKDAGSTRDSGTSRDAKGDAGVGCVIGGATYASGKANPTDACQHCDPSLSTTTWSSEADGVSCGAGMICHTGACVAGCDVAGVFYANAALSGSDPCQSCQPAMSTTGLLAVMDGTDCGNGQVCSSGKCGTQCDISGSVYLSGVANPGNPCQTCQPGTTTSAWTDANGTACGPSASSGEVCNAGVCATGCYIGGVFYASTGALNPMNPCQSCQPATSTTSWSSPASANGMSCGTNEVCNAGACVSGCYITTTVYVAGALDPSNDCMSCQPATSTTAWSDLANGASCGSMPINEGVCAGGACCSAQAACGDACCSITESCATSTCCAFGAACGSVCCGPGQRCASASSSTCSCMQGTTCGATCCTGAQTCATDICCTASEIACGKKCCASGETCTNAALSKCS